MVFDKKISYSYYLLLYLALVLTWARQSFIPMPLRVAYMAALFVPIIGYKISLYIPCLVLFLTTSLLSLGGYTFLPTEISFYIIISLAFVAVSFLRNGARLQKYPYVFFILLSFFPLIVNLVYSGSVEKISYSLFLMILLPYTVFRDDRELVIKLLPKAFIAAAFATALMTLLNQQLLMQVSYDHDRIISGSLNYTCCTMGAGCVFALKEFLNKSSGKTYKLFCIAAMFTILVTIIMEASRGALLAVAVASILIILTQKIGKWTKIFIVALVALFVYLLYNNQILDLLIYRIQVDDGSGTGRTEIWLEKISEFYASMTPLSGLFGIGFDNTWALGGHGHNYIGCHNDFVAFFIEYGVVGLVLFVTMLLMPFFSNKYRGRRNVVMPFLAFIVMSCLTLEPFSMGYLPFYFLLLYIYLVVLPDKIDFGKEVIYA